MENIIENNKIIAEFLDWEFDDLSETFETPFLKLVEPQAFGDEQFSCKLQDFELEFHSDWDWLKLVLEKISYLNKDNFSDETKQALEDLLSLSLFSAKENVYKSIINFIKTIK